MSQKLSHLGESHDAPDQWHRHTADEHPQEAHGEVLSVPTVLAYGTACFLIVVVSVVATVIYFYTYVNTMAVARVEYYDVGPEQTVKIQSEYNALKQKAEADTLKGMRGDGGAIDKVVSQYSKKRGG